MSNAAIGYNTRFAVADAVGSSTFVELAEVFSVTPPSASVDHVDVTHMQSPGRRRQFVPALIDSGSASVEMNYVPNSASDQRLEALVVSGEVLPCKIAYPGGVTVTFSASVESYEKAIPNEDKMTATAAFKISGAATLAAAPA